MLNPPWAGGYSIRFADSHWERMALALPETHQFKPTATNSQSRGQYTPPNRKWKESLR
jgi:hypothetical protein